MLSRSGKSPELHLHHVAFWTLAVTGMTKPKAK